MEDDKREAGAITEDMIPQAKERGYVRAGDDVVPDLARVLVGGIDVQHDGFWVLVEAYGFRARRLLVVDAAWEAAAKNDPRATATALLRLLATRYALAGGGTGVVLPAPVPKHGALIAVDDRGRRVFPPLVP